MVSKLRGLIPGTVSSDYFGSNLCLHSKIALSYGSLESGMHLPFLFPFFFTSYYHKTFSYIISLYILFAVNCHLIFWAKSILLKI